MANKIVRKIIHAKGIDIGIYTKEFENEYISLTDIAKYRNDNLNVALFGQTAKQWKNNNPGKKGNVRDDANLNQLLVLANMESYNAILIEQGKPQSERLINRNALCWHIRLQGITFTRHSFSLINCMFK